MDNYFSKCKNNVMISLLVVLIVIEISILSMGTNTHLINQKVSGESMRAYADTVIKKCAGDTYKATCYDKEIPKLMDYISMEDAFVVTKIVQKEGGAEYAYCHVLGHNLSAKETEKDPSKWKDVITRCPSGMCSNGCIHGAFQERFRTESMTDAEIDTIIPELKTVCESRGTWSPTGMEKASCYHAVGHLIMFISGGDIYKSNKVCEKLNPVYSWLCFDGNFMQIFQPLAPEDFDLIKNIAPKTKEEAEKLCANFTGLMKSSCHQESWPLYFNEIMTPQGLVKFCSYTKDAVISNKCYNALFYIIPVQLKLDVLRIKEFCSAVPDSKKGLCFSSSAARMIETDYNLVEKAVSLCNIADEYGVGKECYDTLIIHTAFNYQPNSSEAKYVCDILPEPWKSTCEEKQ